SNRNFGARWATLELVSSVGTVRCPITMEGSFHSQTFSKVIGALIGYVTKATAFTGNCSGGTASVEGESLPWHVQYGGFIGTLPVTFAPILNLINAKFRVNIGGAICTAQTTAAAPGVGIVSRNESNQATTLRADETRTIPLRGSFLCEIAGS